jgi:hypothetical protein
MNKLLVITGGSRGIGKAVIEKFSSAGFDISVSARKRQDLENLKSEMEKKYHNGVHIFDGDMSVEKEVKAYGLSVLELKRPIDILINNAGYFVPGELSTEPDGAFENTMHANIFSAYYMTRCILPSMKALRSGHIFNMCSIASIKAYANGGSYAISKFALLGFSKCLREELKSYGIRVTAVMPGATKTASWDSVDLPESRFMKVEDVADSIFAAYSLSTRSVVEEIIIRPQLGDI